MGARVRSVRERFRRGLLISGAAVTVFGVLHHVDHVIRGNHSGWPFQEAVTPFTFSLLIYALLLPGLYLTGRRRLVAGYWFFVAFVGLALVFSVHLSEKNARRRCGTSTKSTGAQWRVCSRSRYSLRSS
jgi:hypothetical protein